MLNFIYFILILGLIVLVHEFGHFITAKIFGVYVYEFSIGMGPKLFSFKGKNKETTYSLRLLPIGGFVALAGEEPYDEKAKDIPDNRKLDNIAIWKRFIIMIAGIFNNILLALILFFIIGLSFGVENQKPIIEEVKKDSAFYKAGIKENDKIIKVDDHKVKTIDDLTFALFVNDEIENKKSTEFTVLRDNKKYKFTVIPEIVEEEVKIDEYEKDIVKRKLYGFSLKTFEEKTFKNLIKYPFIKVHTNIKQMTNVFKLLFKGKLGADAFAGPVGIYKVVGDTNKSSGFLGILVLTALFSINVAYLNLLPIPIFDGGKILFLLIEKIRGKKMDEKVENYLNIISAILLILLALLITVFDIGRLFKWKRIL